MPDTTRRDWIIALGLVAVAGASLTLAIFRIASNGTSASKSFAGQVPPEFAAGLDWLNGEQPRTLADLRGQAVWIEFGFSQCPGCQRMAPHLERWQRQYAARGFTVIEVIDGAMETYDEVQISLRRRQRAYPVVYDATRRMCEAYGVIGYPSFYLVGRDGKVVWEGSGFDGLAMIREAEEQIERALGP